MQATPIGARIIPIGAVLAPMLLANSPAFAANACSYQWYYHTSHWAGYTAVRAMCEITNQPCDSTPRGICSNGSPFHWCRPVQHC